MKCVAWDLIFWAILIALGITAFFTIFFVFMPSLREQTTKSACQAKLANYCSAVVCDESPSVSLEGCEKYIGERTQLTKDDCLKLGFTCGKK